MLSVSRRRSFYFRSQRGVCCLRLTLDCQTDDGRMDIAARQSPRYATWDHILPRSQGGADAFNTLLACATCNHFRGDAPAPEGLTSEAERLWREWQKGPRGKSLRTSAPSAKTQSIIDSTLELEDEQGRREFRLARAHALGVTDPRYMPGAKRAG